MAYFQYLKKIFSFLRCQKYFYVLQESWKVRSYIHKVFYICHVCHAFSIPNTWQTLLINQSFLRHLRTPFQDSNTTAIPQKWFKGTSLLTIKSSSNPVISLIRTWSILDSVQQNIAVCLFGLLNICRGLHFQRIRRWSESTLKFEDTLTYSIGSKIHR